MTTPADPQTNERKFRFKDEWLVALVGTMPGVTPELIKRWRFQEKPYVAQALIDGDVLSFREIAEVVKEAFRIDYVDLNPSEIDKDAMQILPEKLCREHNVLPVKVDSRMVWLAMANPLDQEAIQRVGWATSREVTPLFCPPGQLDKMVSETLRPDAMIYGLIEKLDHAVGIEQIKEEEQDAAAMARVHAPVIKLVDAIIANAIKLRASDIHIEHDEASTLVRFRIDGLLKNIMVLPRFIGVGPVVSRIKIMSDLDVAERFRPQDGRAKVRVAGDEVALRVSILPTRVGEKVVMRLLNEKSVQVSMQTLGFMPEVLDRFKTLLNREQGILLVTGPTGSGKTTTLYAALNTRRGESVNIVTVEDPVEYRLSGVNQVQVNEKQGLTFAGVLRSVLRQDPDVLLVGEIRDQETATIAFQAAMTGHLVLSTLHTNDAIGAIPRLQNIGVEPFRVAAGLIGVTAQRLVRRACPHCRYEAPIEELHPMVRSAQIRLFNKARHVKAAGCAECGFSGYTGRLPLIEFLEITPEVRGMITTGKLADEIRATALRTGALHTFDNDALWHIAEGDTTADEVIPYTEFERRKTPRTNTPRVNQEYLPELDADGVPKPSKVLLAVSDKADRVKYNDILVEARFAVQIANDGAAALGILAQDPPDALVVGLKLPILDGRQVVHAARTVVGLIDMPIIVVAPAGSENETGDLLSQGVDDVLFEPLDPGRFRARVTTVMRSRGLWAETEEVMRPLIPQDEAERLVEFRIGATMDPQPEERFDKISRMAQRVFDVPFAGISFVEGDRQWFKSKHGLPIQDTTREMSFCGHAINGEEALVIEDAALDPRFAQNSLVLEEPHIRFYAGHPVKGPGGHSVGTLCIMDNLPREFDEDDRETLRDLAENVEKELKSTSKAKPKKKVVEAPPD
ncbi:MAG TPA: ATPase, T2SS/T4P/T4SS family [Gemmatimonadaceae bacterium]|nr:ATPase, T2SS/T4P/T4SS family [Gemmatimonadaceae bacterium]